LDTRIHQGFFIIADISGYTRFVASHDLEHAQGVLNDLLSLMMERLSAPLQFVELEGDAVFVFAPDQSVTDSENLLDIVEACYAAFRFRVEQMAINTSCTCTACRAIPSLDLKCVAHFGRFAKQKTPTGYQLVGPDVTLTHLLLKNSVIEKTGIKSYALLTDAFIQKSPTLRGDHRKDVVQMKLYEAQLDFFGTVQAGVTDLSASLEKHRQRFRDNLDAAPLDLEIVTSLNAPASIVWSYVYDAEKRPLWQNDIQSVNNIPAENGRTDIGWEGHCDHGAYMMKHRIVDWRPMERITMHSSTTGWTPLKPPPCQVDFIFEQQSTHHCTVRFQVRLRDASLWDKIIFKVFFVLIKKEWTAHFNRLVDFSAREYEAFKKAAAE
jgi:uncharacterized protein YndB with AHSA1/START domain